MRTGIHCWISGRVQGVCFRASTLQMAQGLGLDGWVRNLADGRVEVWACGDPQEVERLRQWLALGPPLARVDDVATSVISEDSDNPGTGFRFK